MRKIKVNGNEYVLPDNAFDSHYVLCFNYEQFGFGHEYDMNRMKNLINGILRGEIANQSIALDSAIHHLCDHLCVPDGSTEDRILKAIGKTVNLINERAKIKKQIDSLYRTMLCGDF